MKERDSAHKMHVPPRCLKNGHARMRDPQNRTGQNPALGEVPKMNKDQSDVWLVCSGLLAGRALLTVESPGS